MDIHNNFLSFNNVPQEAHTATNFVVDVLLHTIWPLIINIRKSINSRSREDETNDVFTLCCSQIKKSVLNLFDIFKLEHQQKVFLQESRHCTLERLSWCINHLNSIKKNLDNTDNTNCSHNEDSEELLLATPTYFVNWLDHAFEVLANLSDAVYKYDPEESTETKDAWKSNLVSCVSELHVCLDELLLSGMTLCKYCLPNDQLVVKARCQVVLRETKALLSEIVTGDPNTVFKVTNDSLKLPIIPSNVDVLIDVLKDVLYALETNTNIALLALVVHCFGNSKSPIDTLKEHFQNGSKGQCPCHIESNGDISEDCRFVKEFDLYNERLLQIGSYAMSSSLDKKRILSIRSGLASLEALDPHLVPALLVSPSGHHSELMTSSWLQEVTDIRDSVFLIVDPTAFAEKSKQMMNEKLFELKEANCYNNAAVCALINIGSVVRDFFSVYNKFEPDALIHHEQLMPLLSDLNKVEVECKIVSNLLCFDGDEKFVINKKPATNKDANFSQLMKRLKLLYTIVSRIDALFHPKEDYDQMFVEEISETPKNLTHTIYPRNGETYVRSPQKLGNNSRSFFARTINTRSVSTVASNDFVLSKLRKQLQLKRGEELSFSMQLNELLDNSTSLDKGNDDKNREIINKDLNRIRNQSVLYSFSSKKSRSSLRKAVLNRKYKVPSEMKPDVPFSESASSDNVGLIDENISLQITEILDQMTDISNMFSVPKLGNKTGCTVISIDEPTLNENKAISKHIWNIPVNNTTSTAESCTNETSTTSNVSNISQPSNVTTLERINDLDLVENKLSNLVFLQKETSL